VTGLVSAPRRAGLRCGHRRGGRRLDGDRWHKTDVDRDRLAAELTQSSEQMAAVSRQLEATRQELADATSAAMTSRSHASSAAA